VSDFSFVYVPMDAENLVGGRVNTAGAVFQSSGGFTLTPQAVDHQVLITIPGKTSDDGILILTASERVFSSGVREPDDMFLVYEYDPAAGGFLVSAHDLPGAGPERDAIFSFAFIEFDNPLALPAPPVLPGDVNGDGMVDRTDAAILLRNLGTDSGAIPAGGDVDGDGAITLSDLARVQSNLGAASGNSPAASSVPEPAGAMMLMLGATCLIGFARAGCRHRNRNNRHVAGSSSRVQRLAPDSTISEGSK
jgi:hypothetical protein